MKARGRAAVVAVTAVLATMSFRCESDFRPDDFHCEEAAKHIEECCPGADPTLIGCVYHSGCGDDSSYAELDEHTSDCIRDASCARVVENGICAAMALRASTAHLLAGGAPAAGTGLVCE